MKLKKASPEEVISNDFIEVFGAREHNLKDIDIKIPQNKLVVFTGVSGSGKSSLAFDAIYNEGKAPLYGEFQRLCTAICGRYGKTGCRQDHRFISCNFHRTKDNE